MLKRFSWFESFYVTQHMHALGVPVIDRETDEPYVAKDQVTKHQVALIRADTEWRALCREEGWALGDTHRYAYLHLRKCTPHIDPVLQPHTYSFLHGPCSGTDWRAQPHLFDDETLGSALEMHGFDGEWPRDRGELLQCVQTAMLDELGRGVACADRHPVKELMSGVLLGANWKCLSPADHDRFLEAHGVDDIEAAVWQQMFMLTEIAEQRARSVDVRGLGAVRARLDSNWRSMRQKYGDDMSHLLH